MDLTVTIVGSLNQTAQVPTMLSLVVELMECSCSLQLWRFPLFPSPSYRRRRCPARMAIEEIRVCTNKTCRRQGSFQTLRNLADLSPPTVVIKSSGCLGQCGSGPNVAILPEGTIVSHCGTAYQAAQLVCDPVGDNLSKTLDALALRRRAEVEFERNDYAQTLRLLTEAIELGPINGIHDLFRLRSTVRLASRDNTGALEDARLALKLFPKFLEAHICQADAHMAMEQYAEAEKSYETCLQIDPSLRRSKSFKTRVAKLNEKLVDAATSYD